MKVNKFVNDLRGQTKAKLFEVPKKPLPTYFHEYQNMLLLKIHVCQEIIESNERDQKSRLLKLITDCDLVQIADDNGVPIDTPRIEREYMARN
ncbi:hypothetical protein RhiirA5_419579 [Rhizophagus irregularis]|uniref:Uncharacterized protein n=2 Tax=Rhizophagus irregularis TaxID=588596 RepID=A0A2I1ELK0_9GLOM|nr:hypothetical protein RhiirA5_419579 [Rhizophagus irregularis]PKY23001.1 hypothetical protein RhiirB3_437094 [Rhizophagus irregularis]UZO00076.1 hypothetical protein OCT59_001330 [Rhizophagus irregularis]CAG8683824.1 7311_t:CDS:2 [Rhizophagus irregularis]